MNVLVTGGTGFIGRAVVQRLIHDGYRVRVLARPSANVDPVAELGAELCVGDITDSLSFSRAFDGCDLVIHLAAGTGGSAQDSDTTVTGTRTLIELCRKHQPKRLVYVSSCSVYGTADCDENSIVTETSALERFPARRGFYSESKQRAERYVTDFMNAGDVPVVIVRPGAVYGPGGDLFPGMMGFGIRSLYFVIGDGEFVPPFVQLDDVAAAISLCLENEEAKGEIFNLVDPQRMTKRQYIDRVIRRVDARARVVYVPYSIVYGLTWMQELACKAIRRQPVLSRYRLESSQKPVIFDGGKIIRRLGWKPTRSLADTLDELVERATGISATPTAGSARVGHDALYNHDGH